MPHHPKLQQQRQISHIVQPQLNFPAKLLELLRGHHQRRLNRRLRSALQKIPQFLQHRQIYLLLRK